MPETRKAWCVIESTDDDSTELRALARIAFYASLGRRCPQRLISVPSYVKAVKRKFRLVSGNAARQILATVEGYKDWSDLMRHTLAIAVRRDHEDIHPTNEGIAPKGVQLCSAHSTGDST